MLTPISPGVGEQPGQLAGVVGHRDEDGGHRAGAPPCLPGMAAAPSTPRSSTARSDPPSAAVERASSAVQVAAHVEEQVAQRGGVAR